MFVHYKTDDPYIVELIKFKEIVQKNRNSESLNIEWVNSIVSEFTTSYRELCISSGELELLEKVDMANHMVQYR